MIVAGSFGDGFAVVWHYGGYLAGGFVAAMVIWWILSFFFDL